MKKVDEYVISYFFRKLWWPIVAIILLKFFAGDIISIFFPRMLYNYPNLFGFVESTIFFTGAAILLYIGLSNFLRGFDSDSEKKAMKKAEKEDEEIEKKLKKIEEAHKK